MSDYEYLSAAETAKLIRVQFKKHFPKQKFYVHSHTYSGGASIDIDWLDGPCKKQVDKVVNPFNGAEFDGMVDLKSYNEAWLMPDGSAVFAEYAQDSQTTIHTTQPHPDAKRVHFGADFIFTNRHYSPDFAMPIIQGVCEKNGCKEPKYIIGHLWVAGKPTEIETLSWDACDFVFNESEWLRREIMDALETPQTARVGLAIS